MTDEPREFTDEEWDALSDEAKESMRAMEKRVSEELDRIIEHIRIDVNRGGRARGRGSNADLAG